MKVDGYVRVSRVAGRSGESFISPDEQDVLSRLTRSPTGSSSPSGIPTLTSPVARWTGPDDRSGYLGAAHLFCNRRQGSKARAPAAYHAPRRVARLYWSRIWFEPVPDDVV